MPKRPEKDANSETTAALARMTGTKPPKDGELLGDPKLRAELARLKRADAKRGQCGSLNGPRD